MKDSYGRRLHYLRISVTDRCNLRCRYCMPEEGVVSFPHGEILTFDEILRLVRIMAAMGTDRVRLTGGEPLVRRGITRLAADIKRVPGIDFLGITTNAVRLEEMAEDLLAAGVDGVNISLDTTDPQRYRELTRRDEYARAYAGLRKAVSLPFASVKVNCVLSPYSSTEDWMSVVALAQSLPVDVRLIEWMPMAGEEAAAGMSAGEALALLQAQYGSLQALPGTEQQGGPARYWKAEGLRGRVGVIPAMSHNFCDACNRLRITATGDLKLCLFYDVGISLKELLRGGATDDEIAGAIEQSVLGKPKNHEGRPMRTEEGGACSLIEHPQGMFKTGG